MHNILRIIKRIVLGAFILYGYNLIAVSFNLIIPINVFTIAMVSFLGFPALFALILFLVISF